MTVDLQDPDLLITLGGDILAAVVAYYLARNFDLPETRYVADGEVALDCPDQLTVSPSRVYNGLPGQQIVETIRAYSTQSIEWEIMLTRCAVNAEADGMGNVRLPTPSDIAGSAATVLRDWQLLRRCVIETAFDGSLFPTLRSPCNNLAILTQRRYGPAGGAVGTVLVIATQVL